MESRRKTEVFANTREMLAMAEAGMGDATSDDPTRRRPGLMNLFTHGRSVTMAIQTMGSVDPGFEDWWKPYQQKMAKDPLMRYFNSRRTDVIHKGALSTQTSTVIGEQGPVDMGALMRELSRFAPPNTISTFFGEGKTGGNGWVVQLPDGSEEKVYFSLPESVDITSTLHLSNPPREHDGHQITDTSIANLGSLYLTTLRWIVEEFETRFA